MKRVLLLISITVLASCATAQKEEQKETQNITILGEDVKLTVLIRDTAIGAPENDRRSYYRVFIDKVEAGRTEIALESQNKKFETSLERNSHLLRIEKYVLDAQKERYVKLNNIEQPKPDFVYFDTSDVSRMRITVVHDVQTNSATYRIVEQ